MEALTGWLGGAYLPVQAAHVVVTFFWIAGLFILPRYLVHQASVPVGSDEDMNWRQRTGKVRRIILTPALIATWVLGLMVATSYGLPTSGWIHAKILLAVLLSGYHGWMVGVSRKMASGERPIAER